MKVDWRTVILTIKEKSGLPIKTIAGMVGATRDTLNRWMRGEHEPRYSQGVELLRLAGME